MEKSNSVIKHIIKQLKDIRNGRNWMGPSFESQLSKLNEGDMFRRPMPNMHSVAEIISHLTFWRKETIVKIKTGRGFVTDDDAGNWLSNDVLMNKGWNAILKEHDENLSELISLLETKDDSFLEEGEYYDSDFNGTFNYSFAIERMLHHDIYHLGQLGMVIKFLKIKS